MRNIKIFVLALTVFAGTVQAKNILEYRCSDTVYQSKLSINNTGLVTIDESCFDACPLHTFTKTYNLSRAELIELINTIDVAKEGIVYQRQVKSSEIDCNGSLSVLSSEGEIIIKEVQVPIYSSSGVAMINNSPACSKLETWVINQVKKKIAAFSH